VTAEDLGEQFVELSALGWVQRGEELVLGGAGVPLDLLQVSPACLGQRDDVTAPVAGVDVPVNVLAAFEAGRDAADLVAVEAEAPPEVCLAERPVLLQGMRTSFQAVDAASG
jgi:hypothetical protein